MRLLKKIRKIIPSRILFSIYQLDYKYCDKKNKDEMKKLFDKQEKEGLSKIPIFLISFNRLSYIQSMIARLEKMHKTNIIIIDNASTYPPLLDYYKKIPYKVFHLKKNYGYRVFWDCPKFKTYRNNFYMLSDPDVEPVEDCPEDFVERFFSLLKKYPFLRKVGFSLKIDDLPQDESFSSDVIKWEKKFYKGYRKEDMAFFAVIDTTFALYMPDSVATHRFGLALRTDFPYQARHMPWYKKSTDVTDEDRFYVQNKTNGWWNVVEGKMTPDKETKKCL